jgi:hypothetical protein
MRGGLGDGVDIEAAEEAVDALVGEAALAEEADFVVQGGVDLSFGGRDEVEGRSAVGGWIGRGELGLRLRIRHLDFAFLLRYRFLPDDVASGDYRSFIGTTTRPMKSYSAKGRNS